MSSTKITRSDTIRTSEELLKYFQEKYVSTAIPGSVYVDTIDLDYVTNVDTIIEEIVSVNRVMLDSLGHTNLELVAELAQTPKPNEMMFICLLNQPKK